MFEQTFKNIDDVLWKEAGCATELDYTEQTSWMLFLKYLDDIERANEQKAELAGKKYDATSSTSAHRWSAWAAPKKTDGTFDHDNALTGDDLIKYVNDKLFPYLKGFRTRAESAEHDRIQDRRNLQRDRKQVPQRLFAARRAGNGRPAELPLAGSSKHELSDLYEDKLKRMGNAGRNGGEYYTPRPLIRAMIQVVKPQIGERIYDGACGSAGFLCEVVRVSDRDRDKLSAKECDTLQTQDLLRPGEEEPRLRARRDEHDPARHRRAEHRPHQHARRKHQRHPGEGSLRHRAGQSAVRRQGAQEVQQNFPIKTGETAFLFLQHFIKSLKAGGRAGIVIKNTFLSNTDNAAWRCARSCWRTATCTRCWTCRAARSRAPASRPWCCSSRRARRRGRSGSTSSIPAATWARPIRSMTRT